MKHVRWHCVRTINAIGLTWIGLCVAVFGWAVHGAYTTPAARPARIENVPTKIIDGVRCAVRNIETVRVAEKVLGRNPEVSDVEREAWDVVDPDDWVRLTLVMHQADGGRVDIELLRPVEWLHFMDAAVGATIELNLPELGAEGPAKVLAIGPCPPIKDTPGQVVTGTFRHSAANLIDLAIEGLAEPIGVTANHPFWSEDRQEFIPAGELKRGERLESVTRAIAKVASLTPRDGTVPVYNLEVRGEHVYYVSESGLLVHNTCSTDKLAGATGDLVRQLGLSPNRQRELLSNVLGTKGTGLRAHHLIPLEAIKKFPELVKKAAQGGFNINGIKNGFPLRAIDHVGGHPEYNRAVLRHLGEIPDDVSPKEAAMYLQEAAETLRKAVADGTFRPWG